MTTTTSRTHPASPPLGEEPGRRRWPEGLASRGFRWLSTGAGALILVVLAAVAVFLVLRAWPALTAGGGRARRGGQLVPRGRVLLELRRPARLRHAPRRRARAAHRDPGRDRDRAVHLALRPAPAGERARLPRRPARRDPARRLRPVGRLCAGADGCSRSGVARRHLGWIPLFAGPARPTARVHPHRRRRARRDDPADHHGRLPGGLPADPAPARGGGARARRHPLGDDPDRRAAVRPVRHHLRRDARPRPGPRRDHGRAHDPSPGCLYSFALLQAGAAPDHRREHRRCSSPRRTRWASAP